MVKIMILKPVIKPCIVTLELDYTKLNTEAKPFTSCSLYDV